MKGHLCLSGHPECSGARPCQVCYTFVKDTVLPRAMTLAGGPFSSGETVLTERGFVPLAVVFIQSFNAAMREGMEEIERKFQEVSDQAAFVQAEETAAEPAPPTIEEFREAIIDRIQSMTEEKYVKTAMQLHNGQFTGWDALSPDEQVVLLELFQPPEARGPLGDTSGPSEGVSDLSEGEPDLSEGEAGESESDPMSAENAAKVVAAIRNGTLSPQTVATGPQQPIEIPEQGISQAPEPHPRVQSLEGQLAGPEASNGASGEQTSVQVTEVNQESTT